LKYLHSIGEIHAQEFSRLRKSLNKAGSLSAAVPENEKNPAEMPASNSAELSKPETAELDAETVASLPLESVEPKQNFQQEIPVASMALEASKTEVAATTDKPAPWDLPDSPEPPPRRTFGELMAGFMEEKNMRWGELTSGILIVLSAVGLVVSLREQLGNTIPYFSSILFLLMTAAIHAAGVYTLRKWNLRNTSRGALAIVLLLIPLNFVAACVLSGGSGDETRRSISDPLLWLAVGIGMAAFSGLAWHSSKYLLRRGYWPMVIAVIGCGGGTLLLGRLIETTSASIWYLVYSLPVLLSFIVGTCFFDVSQWQRVRWSRRAANRLYLFLGITTFAALCASSMAIVRGESKLFAVVSLTPIASVICIVTCWLGSTLKRGSHKCVNQKMTGLSLEVLGFVLLGMSILTSLSNPFTFFINGIFGGIGLLVMFIHQRNEKPIGIAWALLCMSLLAGMSLATREFSVDVWTSFGEIKSACLNGRTGLSLLVAGVLVVAFHGATRNVIPNTDRRKSFMLAGWLSGAGLLLVGCIVALVASLVNRDSVFDVMTASCLLGVASVACIVGSLVGRRRKLHDFGLGHVSGVLLLATLAHGLLWNPSVAEFVASFNRGNRVLNWAGVAVVHGLVMGLAGWFSSRKGALIGQGNSAKSASLPNQFGAWAAATTILGSIGLLALVPMQSGWATAFALLVSLNWYLIGRAFQKRSVDKQNTLASVFVLSTGLVVGVGVAELATRFPGVPKLDSLAHGLVQSIGLAVWASVWTIGMILLNRKGKAVVPSQLGWIRKNRIRVEQWVLFGVVVVIASLLSVRLFDGASQELSRHLQSFTADSVGMFWVYLAIAAAAIGTVISIFEKPNPAKGVALVVIWSLAWVAPADAFAGSKSVASAIRWLLPIGGLVGACVLAFRKRVLPAWTGLRNGCGIAGPSRWSKGSTQALINFGLSIVAGGVILISTVTVSQVLVSGADALGGPTSVSWFKSASAEISFGLPVAIVVATFLLLAIAERRSLLATLGSVVFQYIVLLAVVLLFVSPHPKLASSWFINILQVVSLGMTVYGFVWWRMRDQISPVLKGGKKSEFGIVDQLEVHTLINGLLVSSLAVLVMVRFYSYPGQPGNWISSVGSLLGLAALASFGVLGVKIWNTRINRAMQDVPATVASPHRIQPSKLMIGVLIGWMGILLVALLAAGTDRFWDGASFMPWLSFRVIAVGTLVVAIVQSVFLAVPKLAEKREANRDLQRLKNAWPVSIVAAIGLAFAIRGALFDPTTFWFYFTLIYCFAVLAVAMGWQLKAASASFVSAAVAVAGVTMLRIRDPHGWFTQPQPYGLHLTAIAVGAVAIVWLALYLFQRKSKKEPIARTFVAMPNMASLLGSVWVFAAASFQVVLEVGDFGGVSSIANPLGIAAFITMFGLSIVMVWNDRARFKLICRCLLSMAAMVMVLAYMMPSVERSFELWSVAIAFGASVVVLVWSLVWFNRKWLSATGRKFGQTRFAAFENRVGQQLPAISLIVGSGILLIALVAIFNVDARLLRYLTAASPFVLAISLGLQSDPKSRRWIQSLSLACVTAGVLFLAWADLTPDEIYSPSIVKFLIRTLIVLAGLMFVYGSLVTRWVRIGDTWLASLREMAGWTCGLAIVSFVVLLFEEASEFNLQGGSGAGIAESSAAAILVLGMIVGLITIAIRPENDPFALSLKGRMGYVYAAEAVAAGLVGHVYLSMPWLFRFGILEYWPYVMMAICFAGVGVAKVLEKRNLVVLGRPLFQTAAVIPLLVAGGIFAVSSRVDVAVVMLTVGMAYLLIGFIRQSVLSGAGAIVFGTIALWIFLESRLSFIEHPQMWLIPPSVAVLIASQLVGKLLDSKQLTTIRYLCVTVIYVSSTSEIFINGVGEKLWPPIVLAVLSVLGVMLGIMFRVKSYLYLGSLFLLTAMITMVAHAHQRLEHVWPWWAFGIGLGIAILVMFGVFEKRKNELNAIAQGLKEWQA
jgi:hypothetical protein